MVAPFFMHINSRARVRMAVLTMESVVDLLKEESERVITRLSVTEDIHNKLYMIAHLISLSNKSKRYKKTHYISEEVESMIQNSNDGVVSGIDAHRSATLSDIKTTYLTAIRHYTADKGSYEHKAHYTSINRFYRFGEGANDETDSKKNKRVEDWQKTDRILTRMFSEFPGIAKPIRVYRGVSLDVFRDSIKQGFYSDKGYTSATTSLDMAIQYAGQGGAVLVIDLKKGSKAISLMDYSRKPYEEEILLPRGVYLPIKTDIINKKIVDKLAEVNVVTVRVSNEKLGD